MATTFLTYPLIDGYLHNWLVAGPLAMPVSPEPAASPEAEVTAVLRRHHQPESGVTEPVVDLGPLGGGTNATWRYHRCRDDHFVDFTAAQPVYVHVRAWAYAQVTVPAAQDAQLVLTTDGTADAWAVGGQHLQRVEHSERRPRSVTVPFALQAGPNEILVRFETAGVGDVPLVMALRLEGVTGAQGQLPANFEPDLLEKRLGLEALAYAGTLDRYVYGYFDGDRYDKNEAIELRFPADAVGEGELTFRLQSLQGDIFQERTPKVGSGTAVSLARTFPLRGGPHHLATTPVANDYYIKQLRFDRKELFYIARTAYTVKAGATLKARREEALDDASKRRSGSLYTELAKMALGQMDKVETKVLTRALAGLENRHHGAVLDLLAGLVAVRRFAKKKPRLNREFRVAVEAAAARCIYQPADYGDTLDSRDFVSEARQIVYHACEILAGQLLPDRTFEVTEQPGAWHRERGEAAALAWLRQRGAYGFTAWDSPAGTEEVIAALAVLADLADSEAVSELAAVLLDKVLFGLAVNSWAGAYGSSRGQADTGSVLSARLEPTSGLQRLLWGRGNFNEHVLGVVCLALCRRYEVPPVIAGMATAPVDAFWNRERHTDPARGWSVEKAAYKTRDFLLASAQDYAPGSSGRAEHIWQATLGPDAVVFVNHPANTSVDDAHRPNFWAGNGVLPKVGQWGDVLIALHQLPEDDWLGYTHAYFPTTAFDEYALDGQWAFARKGTGYLALRAENGLQFTTTGSAAFRELRSPGAANAWLCHMGQALLDGSFEQFREKVKALDVSADGLTVRAHTLRGDRLEMGWATPLLINGEAQPLAPERHIENAYCVADLPASVVEIVAEGGGVRLRFE